MEKETIMINNPTEILITAMVDTVELKDPLLPLLIRFDMK